MTYLDASKTSLLLIDVQNFVLDRQNHPPRPEFYRRFNEVVRPRLGTIMASCRKHSVEVLFTVMESLTVDGRDRSLDYKLSGFHIHKGSHGAKIPEPFLPKGDEIVLSKTSSCLLHSTNAAYILRNMGIDTVLLSGFLTDQCVEQTAKAGCSMGFRMICVEDVVAANTNLAHQYALSRIANYADIKNANEIIRAIT